MEIIFNLIIIIISFFLLILIFIQIVFFNMHILNNVFGIPCFMVPLTYLLCATAFKLVWSDISRMLHLTGIPPQNFPLLNT